MFLQKQKQVGQDLAEGDFLAGVAPKRLPGLGVVQQPHGALGGGVDGAADFFDCASVRVGPLQEATARESHRCGPQQGQVVLMRCRLLLLH